MEHSLLAYVNFQEGKKKKTVFHAYNLQLLLSTQNS